MGSATLETPDVVTPDARGTAIGVGGASGDAPASATAEIQMTISAREARPNRLRTPTLLTNA
jgi:hypothetical protein